MNALPRPTLVRRILGQVLVVALSATATPALFMVLPLIQAITDQPHTDLLVRAVDSTSLPPPPPPPEVEQEQEPEPEDAPPELAEELPQLDLSQLELALQGGTGEGWGAGDFSVDLSSLNQTLGKDVDALFSMADLDTRPRVVHQPAPVMDAKLRRLAPGTVYVLFVVDTDGRVEEPRVQSSTDPGFERAALAAVKKWKFEPGRRNGEAVRFRMRVPITFPEA